MKVYLLQACIAIWGGMALQVNASNLSAAQGIEYGGYILCDDRVLDKDGNCAATIFLYEDFDVNKANGEGEDLLHPSGFGGYLHLEDVWPLGRQDVDKDGCLFLYVPIDGKKKNEEEVVLSVCMAGNRLLYTELGNNGYLSALNLALPPKESPEGQKRPPNEVCASLGKLVLRAHHGEDVRQYINRPEADRRKKLYEKRELEKNLCNQRWLDRELNQCFGHAAETIAALGLEIPQAPGKIPNVNNGIHKSKALAARLSRALASAPGQKAALVHIREYRVWKELFFVTGRNTRIRVVMKCTYNISQAFRMMYRLPEAELPDDVDDDEILLGEDRLNWSAYTPEELVGMLEPAEGVVGEYAIRRKQMIGEDGLPVKGSEKRSIYFTRGNTAVGVFTDNPAFNVLPLAREIDKLLVEGMRKAGEPLTKEQDYLKEEKKQK